MTSIRDNASLDGSAYLAEAPSRAHFLNGVALIAAVTCAAALFGHVTRPVGFLASFWPANALLLGLMVRNPNLATPLGWAGAAAGYLAADFLMGSEPLLTLWLTAGNLANAITGHLLFQRVSAEDRRLGRPQSLLFLLLISIAAAAAATVVGSGCVVVYFDRPLIQAIQYYLSSEIAANLIVLPMVLTAPSLRMSAGSLASWARPARESLLKLMPVAALICSVVAGAVLQGPGAIAVPIPAILWCALSYGVFQTAILTFGLGLWQATTLATNLPPSSAGFLTAVVSHRLGVALLSLGPIMIASTNAARTALLGELDRAASQDALTGVLSRRALLQRGEALLADGMARARPVALLMLDIDHFKRVNDRHGHATGDAALVALAQTMRDMLRPGDLFGRLGGEEFAILLPGLSRETAAAVAERLRQGCAGLEIPLAYGKAISVTVSIGIACQEPEAASSLKELLSQADAALYEAKQSGRNRVVEAAQAAA